MLKTAPIERARSRIPASPQCPGRPPAQMMAESIPQPIAPPVLPPHPQVEVPQGPPPPPPIPLKFYGFATQSGGQKKVFLAENDDIFIAAEGDIVDRRYKVIRITNTSVEIQDVVNSGPPQTIPLTQG